MNRALRLITTIFKSQILWFTVGVALLPSLKYLGRYTRQPTAFESMGWVSHYQETKHFSTVLPDFSYSLQFPGDREKFENFIKRMNLQGYKVSNDEYKKDSNEGGSRATFSPDKKGFEIEFTAYQT
ncbi:MAG: hypothetical protein ABI162_08030 [Luteolibacter sp.]